MCLEIPVLFSTYRVVLCDIHNLKVIGAWVTLITVLVVYYLRLL